MRWLDLLAVHGTLKSLLQHHSLKASVLQHSTFFIVKLSHPYMTTGKTRALTRRTFVDKVVSLFFNMLSSLVIAFLPRIKRLLISWLQLSPSGVISFTVFISDPLEGGRKKEKKERWKEGRKEGKEEGQKGKEFTWFCGKNP